METNTRKKMVIKIVVGILLFVFILLVLFLLYINFQYNSATKLYDTKSYSEALAGFKKLGNYRESERFIALCNIGLVDIEFDAGNYEDAKSGYLTLEQTEEVKAKVLECDYQVGLAKIENADFKAARLIFEGLGSYKDSSDMVSECTYQEGIQSIGNQNYYLAYSLLCPLQNYKDTENQLQKIKYARYNALDVTYPRDEDVAYAQENLEFIQSQPWYIDDTLCDLSLGDYMFIEQFYQVKSCSLDSISHSGSIDLYMLSENDEYTLSIQLTPFFPGSEYQVYGLYGYSVYDDEDSTTPPPNIAINCFNVSSEELARINEEMAMRQRSYDDNTIADYTVNIAKQWLEEEVVPYTSYRALASCSLESASVTYDWTTDSYTCYATVIYLANPFDGIFGGDRYSVTATYFDTGDGLKLASFSGA